MPYLRIFGREFENNFVIFEISTLEFVLLQNFVKKIKKCLNLGLKMPYLGIFGLEFIKHLSHIWNQHPWICLIKKIFAKKQKCLNLEPKMSYLRILELEFSKKNIVMIEISILRLVKKWVSNSYSEFWYRVPIFKRFGVHFFWRSRSRSGYTL